MLQNRLQDIQEIWSNPIALRDTRRERRRNRILGSIALFMGMIAVALALAYEYAVQLSVQSYDYRAGYPTFVSGDLLGRTVTIGLTGIHFWLVLNLSQRRVDRMLEREASLDGMTSLFMLPLSRLRVLLYMVVHPLRVAIGLSALTLPIYMVLLSLGWIHMRDLLGLMLVFAFAAVAVPRLRSPAINTKLSTAILDQASLDGQVAHTQTGMAARITSYLLALPGKMRFAIVAPGALFFFQMIVLDTGRWWNFVSLLKYVPGSIASLWSSAIISFPLMTARILFSNLEWYGVHIRAAVFIVPIAVLLKACHIVRVSEYLSVGDYRALAALKVRPMRRTVEACAKILLSFAVLGYLWPWAVRDDGLGFLAIDGARAHPGLQGLYAALSVAAACSMLIRGFCVGLWQSAARRTHGADITAPFWPAIRFCTYPFAVVGALLLFSYLVGGRFAVPDVAWIFVFAVILTTVIATVFLTGLLRALGAPAIVGMAAVLGLLLFIAWQMPLYWVFRHFWNGDVARWFHAQFVTSGSNQGPGAIPIVYKVLAAVALLGCGFHWIVWRIDAQAESSATEGERTYAPLDPLRDGSEVLGESVKPARESRARSRGRLKDRPEREQPPFSRMVIAFARRTVDNPVLTNDLRISLRNRPQTIHFVGLLAIALCVAVYIQNCHIWDLNSGNEFAQRIFGAALRKAETDYYANYYAGSTRFTGFLKLAYLQGCCYNLMAFAGVICGLLFMPQGFGKDIRKQRLSDALNSDMSPATLLLGRLLALMARFGVALIPLFLLSLVLCFPLAYYAHSGKTFLWWIGITGSTMIGYTAVGLIVLAIDINFAWLAGSAAKGWAKLVLGYLTIVGVTIFADYLYELMEREIVTLATLWSVGTLLVTLLGALAAWLILKRLAAIRAGESTRRW